MFVTLLLPVLVASALAKTDLTGCTTSDISSPAGASVIWYVPGTGEICAPLDCGGGRAPPKTTVPGCAAYKGTATYSPSYLTGFASSTSYQQSSATSSTARSMTGMMGSPMITPGPASQTTMSSNSGVPGTTTTTRATVSSTSSNGAPTGFIADAKIIFGVGAVLAII